MYQRHAKTCIFVLLLLAAAAARAEIYRWVDKDGQVHFEDRSQSESANGTRSYAAPQTPADDTQQRLEKTRKLLNAYQAERQKAREEKEKAEKEQAKRKRQCAVARDDLRQYQDSGRIYRLNDAGKRVYLSDKERSDLIERYRAGIAKWCR